MSATNTSPIGQQAGRGAAILGYGLFLLSIPSAAVFALFGVIVALSSVGDAAPLPRAHLQNQIHIWMTAFWWSVVLFIIGLIGWLLTLVLIGFPIVWAAAFAGFLVMLWFTIKSALGLLALLDGREP